MEKELEMIPLLFLDIASDGKSRYKRLDTEEVLVGRVKLLTPNSVVVYYKGKETIKVPSRRFPPKEANGVLFAGNPRIQGEYECTYCVVE